MTMISTIKHIYWETESTGKDQKKKQELCTVKKCMY